MRGASEKGVVTVSELQLEMRRAFVSGYVGVLVSGIIWFVSGVAAYFASDTIAMICLFFGGMLIHPLAGAGAKRLFGAEPPSKDNPLNLLALESTALLFVGLFLAYIISFSNSTLFFSAMLLVIGVRYLLFQSIYGLKFFWILGALLVAVGLLLTIAFNALPSYVACFVGGGIEILMGAFRLAFTKNQDSG